MWKFFPIVLSLSLASCAASNSHGVIECSDDSQATTGRDSANPPPDSGYGPPSRLEGSYRKVDVPKYPQVALDDKVTGTVYVHVWIRTDGSVSDAAIEQVHPRSAVALTEGLANRIRDWLFNPVEIHGNAIASEFIVPVKFSIKDHTPPSMAEPVPSLPANAFVLETVKVESK
jgi:TonB family protein